jgi:hypothetical protein
LTKEAVANEEAEQIEDVQYPGGRVAPDMVVPDPAPLWNVNRPDGRGSAIDQAFLRKQNQEPTEVRLVDIINTYVQRRPDEAVERLVRKATVTVLDEDDLLKPGGERFRMLETTHHLDGTVIHGNSLGFAAVLPPPGAVVPGKIFTWEPRAMYYEFRDTKHATRENLAGIMMCVGRTTDLQVFLQFKAERDAAAIPGSYTKTCLSPERLFQMQAFLAKGWRGKLGLYALGIPLKGENIKAQFHKACNVM